MTFDIEAPAMLRPHADADARPGRDRLQHKASIFDEQMIANKVATIVRQSYPHRHGQVAGASTELVPGEDRRRTASFRRAGAAPAHEVDAVKRIERTDQHGRRRSVR